MECNRGYDDFDENRPEDSKETEAAPANTRNYLLLKGEMKYISDINSIVFLCSPM